MKRKNIFSKMQVREICYNLINAGLAGLLVLLGSFSSGELTLKGFVFAIVAAIIVVATKFKEYWDGESSEYTSKLFSFIK
jgi:hypothetical protein